MKKAIILAAMLAAGQRLISTTHRQTNHGIRTGVGFRF